MHAWAVLALLAAPRLLVAVEEPFTREVRPLLQEYCLKCHSTEKQKGDLDLEVFDTQDAVKRHPKVWQGVLEQLESGEMPPKGKPQLSTEQRAQLARWTRGVLETVARERAGDPGPVVLRRLSNAEYTYTLRDLTGLESLEPAREFPADGAAGEGFTNTGQALTMSPALLTKYLGAAKEVAAHAVLLPDGGIRFSAGTTRRDWTDELVGKIRSFYAHYTSEAAGQAVNLQGIKFETNAGGGLPVERYLAALLKARDSKVEDLEGLALREHLSAKYLAQLRGGLVLPLDRSHSPVLEDLRQRWLRAGPPEQARECAAVVAGWQKALWKFNTVGHLGRPGGPKSWMEPANPLAAQQEIRLKLPPVAKPGGAVPLFLTPRQIISTPAAGLAEGPVPPAIIWERPRFVAKGRPDVLLRDVAPEAFAAGAPDGEELDAASLYAPSAAGSLAFAIPAEVAKGAEFVVTARLALRAGERCVQPEVSTTAPAALRFDGPNPALPILVQPGTLGWMVYEKAFAEFRELFPAALCYAKIVPTDEVITSVLFHREDDQLCRLMLDEAERAELDRLWAELRFVSQDALTRVDVLNQIIEYASQDSDPKPFMAMRAEFGERAARFRAQQIATEPGHLESVLEFAGRAYRRPLTSHEGGELRELYHRLRRQDELPHEEAIRLTLARVLVAPGFLYRGEEPGPGVAQAPVSAEALASRLSYFLWSSQPDERLRAVAASGALLQPATLRAETQRMLGDARIRRLALEFGCQWLHLRDFATLNEKSEREFPTFTALREAMLEETVQTFVQLFQHDGSVLSLLDGDSTFLNEPLARHYGIPGVSGAEWRRVEGLRALGRGGVLGQASVLAKQAGASRTSPILRGDFIVETLLGEKIPRPPKDVPPFPEEAAAGEALTVREITEKHTSDERCASCHRRIDPFGFALEAFDGIGRPREHDAAGHLLETRATLPDGTQVAGLEGLQSYLLGPRREAFVHQFCRKLLGFALGRGVQLSDEPLLAEMQAQLAAHEYRVSAAIETIVQSRPFREIRGREMKIED